MASYPPGKCCTVGVKHEGQASGNFKKIANVATYFAFPENKATDHAIIIIPDVFGHESINVQLIADQFAANGYLTVILDPFRGDAIPWPRPENFDIAGWRKDKGPETVDPIVTTVIKEVRKTYNAKKIGAVGYCFGAKAVVRFLGPIGTQNDAKLDAGYSAHPSFVDEEEIAAIEGPFSIAAAETDSIFPEEKRHKTEQILKELSLGPKKIAWQINLFSSVEHGFATRANLKDPRQRFAKEQAFIQAVQWFDHHLKGIGA